MGKPFEIEDLKAALRDNRQHIALGKITQLGVSPDQSCLRVQVLLLDPSVSDDREVVAIMGWDDCGPDCGSIRFPETDDLVLVCFPDPEAPDHCYVIKRLTSKQEKIPLKAMDGHSVYKALAGKKAFLNSDTGIHLTKEQEGTEPLVLGNVLVTALTAFLNDVLNAAQIGQCAVGPVMLDPSIRTAWTQHMQTYLSQASTNILSQLGFTERGT